MHVALCVLPNTGRNWTKKQQKKRLHVQPLDAIKRHRQEKGKTDALDDVDFHVGVDCLW
jgi:hypothetical protein